MRKIKELFSEHPNNIEESYLIHMGYSLCYGFNFFCAGIACIIHAIFPFLFKKIASDIAGNILDSVEYRRDDE